MGHVYFHVEMIPQGQNPICWIACVAMITSFKTKTTHPISEFTGGFDPSGACIPDPNTGWNDLYANLANFGFSVDGASMSISPNYIENMLKRQGPFMIFVNVVDFPFYGPVCVSVGSGTHALVVNGIDTNTGNVMIVNPWGTTTPPADLDVVVKAMQDISNDGLNPVAYM
jgi:Papain-like cysteine protease AvrRpt2